MVKTMILPSVGHPRLVRFALVATTPSIQKAGLFSSLNSDDFED